MAPAISMGTHPASAGGKRANATAMSAAPAPTSVAEMWMIRFRGQGSGVGGVMSDIARGAGTRKKGRGSIDRVVVRVIVVADGGIDKPATRPPRPGLTRGMSLGKKTNVLLGEPGPNAVPSKPKRLKVGR